MKKKEFQHYVKVNVCVYINIYKYILHTVVNRLVFCACCAITAISFRTCVKLRKHTLCTVGMFIKKLKNSTLKPSLEFR